MTEARLAARPTAVWATPASVRDQADSAIPARPEPARPEALLRRPRHRRRALRRRPAAPRTEPAVTGAAGQRRRQEDATNRQGDKGTSGRGDRSHLLLVPPSPCPLVYLFTADLLPLFSFRSSEPRPSQLSITILPFSITSVSGMTLSSIFVRSPSLLNLNKQSARTIPGTLLSILCVIPDSSILWSLNLPSMLSAKLFCSSVSLCFAAVESIVSASAKFLSRTDWLNLPKAAAVCFGSSSETAGGGGGTAACESAQR